MKSILFDIKDYKKNRRKYLGKKVLLNKEDIKAGMFGDGNFSLSESTEIYIALTREHTILYLYKVEKNSNTNEGHNQAWNDDDLHEKWDKIKSFKYGPYRSWNASFNYVKYVFLENQLEFNFGELT